jgi:hypothetical protein
MGGISGAGNERLRALLVTGATAVIRAAMRPGSRLMTEWLAWAPARMRDNDSPDPNRTG